jgi:hypothetical protein
MNESIRMRRNCMSESNRSASHRRFGRYVRRNLVGYLALAVAISITPAVASHLNVTSSDLAKNAVTTPKIKNGAVTKAKLKNKAVTASKIANLEKRHVVGTSSGVAFTNGGEGDCIWQSGAAAIPGLSAPNYYKDHLGVVHLQGVAISADGAGGDAACDSVQANDGIVFTLPAAYRPQFTEIHETADTTMILVGNAGLVSGTVSLPAGTVYGVQTSGSTPQLIADGISFRTSKNGGKSSPQSHTLSAAGRKLLDQLLGQDA